MSSTIPSDPINGCGQMLLYAFKRLTLRHRRTISTSSLQTNRKATGRRQHGGSDERPILDNSFSISSKKQTQETSPLKKCSRVQVQANFVGHQRHYVAAATSAGDLINPKKVPGITKRAGNGNGTKEGSMLKELDDMTNKNHVHKGHNNLVRATSGNVMIYGHLGNLGGAGGKHVCPSQVIDFFPRTAVEERELLKANQSPTDTSERGIEQITLSREANERSPKALNSKNGTHDEALTPYASSKPINPNNAAFRINRSVALASSGQLIEAIHECRRALRVEPRWKEAHHLMANLFIRLGEAEKAMYHYKHAGPDVDPQELEKARDLQEHLIRCTEAKRKRDWNSIIEDTELAINSGAASSPQIFSLQAEAYLKLHRHEDADIALSKATQFDEDACKKFYGPVGSANLLRVKAQVDMAAGRFDDALEAAQRAGQLDSNSREVSMVAKKAQAVAQARSKGNDLFRESKYSEAYEAYNEGLDHDPYNSVLLCNRAACLFKLGQYGKAAKDCTAALSVRHSYIKAKLRRADCNAKMGKWEAAIKDYEELLQKSPEQIEVQKAMARAKFQLSKQRIREETRQDAMERGCKN
uniref:Uncharacterized protein n=1 Tax=Kalanchoe fedtschenkoi TaxID=63787 RepID=A0A7N0V701_KALFE